MYHYYQRCQSGCHTDNIKNRLDWIKSYFIVIDLFEKNQNLYDSLVSNNNFQFYKKYDVLFGIKFFTFFKYLVFNYDDKRIEFYSNDISIIMLESKYYSITKTLYIIIHIICLLMIVILALISKDININNIK